MSTRLQPLAKRRSEPREDWARRLLTVCLFTEACLIFLHFRLALHPTAEIRLLGQAFDVTRESSIGTYWSCLIALGTGVVCFFIARLLLNSGVSKLRYRGWYLAGTVFVFLSIDDAIALHEKIGAITSLGLMRVLDYPSYPWHVTVAPIVIVGMLLAVFVIWRDVRKIEGLTAMVVLAMVCFAAALGLDIVEGVKEMTAMLATEMTTEPTYLPIMMLTEEVLEMAGTTILLYVVFAYLMTLTANATFRPALMPQSADVLRAQSEPA